MKIGHWLVPLVLTSLLIEQSATAQDKAKLPEKVPFNQANLRTNFADTATEMQQQKDSSAFLYRVSGQISAARKSELSFRVPGYIKRILAKPGDAVKKGQVLAELDATDYRLQLELAEVQRKQAAIQEEAAKKEYEREVQLQKQNASTGSVFDKINAAYQQAQVGIQQAKIKLQTAHRNLEHTKLVAPYDCIVAEQSKDEAEFVSQGTKTFTVYELNATEVDLDIPERLIGKLSLGSEIVVSVPAVGFSGDAKVTRMVPIVSNRTRTFKVTAEILDKDERVVPGLFAEAQLK